MEKDTKTLLVVGASGSIGRLVVQQALSDGYKVRALVRDRRQSDLFPPAAEVAVGDLSQVQSLGSIVEGIDNVVFTHGTYGRPDLAVEVDYGMVRNLLQLVQGRTIRISLMSTVGVTDRKGSHDWKRRGERLVRESGCPYTIVRPGWFDYNEPAQQRLVMSQGDKYQTGTPQDGVISRSQLAKVLVRSLVSDAARRKTFELTADVGPEQANLDDLFAALDSDLDNSLDGRHDLPNMPLQDEPEFIQLDLRRLR